MSGRARRASTPADTRVIGGVTVRRRATVRDQVGLKIVVLAVSEVIEQSASLSLDAEKDRATLVKRISYALGLDS